MTNKYDSLTGLLTREAFFEEAEALLRKNPDKCYDIVLSDFVNFKHFNTRFGVEAGDFLLVKTVEMLSSSPDVLCARYGGDRFVSITDHLNAFALDFLQNFKLPEKAKNELPIESIVVKFGVCANIDPHTPVSVACDRALIAVQSIKNTYGKNVGIYDACFDEKLKLDLRMQEEMLSALREGQFEVFYQPKMDIADGTVIGAEALVRWIHPTRGIVMPGRFVPVFEKNGSICELDRFVRESVVKRLAERRDLGLPVLPVSVNVSRVDFPGEDLSSSIIDLMARYDLDPSLLHIEITESAYTETPEPVLRHIKTLHDHGFIIELDDFGTGYSSLSFLSNAAIDIIKLDRSLISTNSEPTRNILIFAIQMAKMMRLSIIQEGVETAEQLEQLKALGCEAIQGYFFSKPLPRDEYDRFIEAHTK